MFPAFCQEVDTYLPKYRDSISLTANPSPEELSAKLDLCLSLLSLVDSWEEQALRYKYAKTVEIMGKEGNVTAKKAEASISQEKLYHELVSGFASTLRQMVSGIQSSLKNKSSHLIQREG